jgi:hypothetical protein
LALEEKLLDWDLGFVEFGLVDEVSQFGELEMVGEFGGERESDEIDEKSDSFGFDHGNYKTEASAPT